MTHCLALSTLLLVFVGCGPTQPSELTNAVVTIEGLPNGEVFVSTDWTTVTVEGRNRSETGSGGYGRRILDETGQLKITSDGEQVHGLDLVVVTLDESPVTVKASADGVKTSEEVLEGTLRFTQVLLGYQPDYQPGHPMYHDPKDSVYEAEQLLKDQSSGDERETESSSAE